MMEQEQLELIQAAVDGELKEHERPALEALLANSEEAQRHHDELKRLADFLDRIPSRELPDGLHARVVDSVALPKPPVTISWFKPDSVPAFFRYGVAAAAVAVVTLVVYQAGKEIEVTNDFDNMVGTVARHSGAVSGTLMDEWKLTGQGTEGSVRLVQRAEVLALEFDLDTRDPIEFSVSYSDTDFAFEGFAQGNQNLHALKISQGQIQGESLGDQQFVLLMKQSDTLAQSSPGIELSIEQAGKVIQQGWLKPD